jgi:hypothetical protein
MANALIRKARSRNGGIGFTLTIPGWLNTDELDAELKGKSQKEARAIHSRHLGAAIAFWRSLGFRRIGASGCFGLATDPAHKAHKIPQTDDYDPQERSN